MDTTAILKLMWIAILTIPHKLFIKADPLLLSTPQRLFLKADPLFLSTEQLSDLVETEIKLIMILKKHVQNQEIILNSFKRFVKEYEGDDGKKKDSQDYRNNPIETYLLLSLIDDSWKEFVMEWEKLPREELLEDIEHFQKTEITATSADLNGTINALIRLQDVYRLSSATIAKGILNGIHYGTELTAGDCYRIGMTFFYQRDFDNSLSWLIEGLQKLEKEYHKTANKSKILQHLVYIAFMKDPRYSTPLFTNHFLNDTSNNDRALYNIMFYENLWEREEKSAKTQSGHFEDKNNETSEFQLAEGQPQIHPNTKNYKKLCSYEFSKPVKETSKLKCQYTDNGNAFLRLARVREEEIHVDPKIMLYHDVIYEKEIEVMKEISRNKMEIANFRKGGGFGVKSYRTAKIYWVSDFESIFVKNVNRRTSDITGLKLDDAEQLQLANYGVGGQYEPHYDFITPVPGIDIEVSENNRIGTMMFYLNDVEQGGATVFINLNVTVKPEKGAALFWYNLYPDGNLSFETMHAACPVLVGSKWAANKWFHERSQMLTKPCGLSRDVHWKDL